MIPELFTLGEFIVSGYLFFYTLGLVTGSLIILYLAKKNGLDLIETINYLIFLLITVLVGARIYGVAYTFIKNPSQFDKQTFINSFISGGIFYGGLIVGVIFIILYSRKYFKEKRFLLYDFTAMGAAIGHSIGRLGCFSAGCCFGRPTNLPWGVKIPFLAGHPHPYRNVYIHPTQLYESVLNLLNFIFLIFLFRKRKFDGQIGSLYLINYGIIRFFVEFFRNDSGRGYIIKNNSPFLSLSIPQLISIGLIITGITTYKLFKKRKNI